MLIMLQQHIAILRTVSRHHPVNKTLRHRPNMFPILDQRQRRLPDQIVPKMTEKLMSTKTNALSGEGLLLIKTQDYNLLDAAQTSSFMIGIIHTMT